jgi:UV DNA damage endonuclease
MYGLCCISLNLQELDEPLRFQTMTYKRFSSLPREEAVHTLGERILNNMTVTEETIKYCSLNNLCYRVSSSLFPLITYDEANISLEELPQYEQIQNKFKDISQAISSGGVRISCHPSEFNVLASTNSGAVEKTIQELNFYSSFLDNIGCKTNYNAPINLHIHNKNGTYSEIIDRFMQNFDRLDPNCRARLIIENDDKINCWSVKELIDHFHTATNIPITFDYLHHLCNPDSLSEQEALELCYLTWGNYKPLFHYSESAPGNNPRKHADYAVNPINTYGLDFDLDFELKMKDKAILQHKEQYSCMMTA